MGSKIKILHIHTLTVVSGSGINTLMTMQGLKKAGYEVEFAAAPGGALVKEVEKSGIRFFPIKHLKQSINIFSDFLAFLELVFLMKSGRYTIIHTHNSKAGFLGRLAAKFCGVPIIVHTVHGFSFHDRENVIRRKLFIVLERFVARFTDKMIVVSSPLKDWGLRVGVGKAGQYIVIPDGIDALKFRTEFDKTKIRMDLGFSPQDLIIGVVAKLWEGKGHEEILSAAQHIVEEMPHVKFLFVGDGPLRDKLEKIVFEKGLSSYVVFAGFRSDIPEVTSIFDIAVLASLFEGLGRVLLEAMFLGKPVVATRVGGIPEIVKDGHNGFLVPAGDHHKLSDAVIRLLKDPCLRSSMGEAGKKMMDERFSSDRMIQDIIEVYSEFLNKAGAEQ